MSFNQQDVITARLVKGRRHRVWTRGSHILNLKQDSLSSKNPLTSIHTHTLLLISLTHWLPFEPWFSERVTFLRACIMGIPPDRYTLPQTTSCLQPSLFWGFYSMSPFYPVFTEQSLLKQWHVKSPIFSLLYVCFHFFMLCHHPQFFNVCTCFNTHTLMKLTVETFTFQNPLLYD